MIVRLELQVLAAVVLDMAIGDPWGFPHPVRGIGWAVEKIEFLSRRILKSPRKAGVLTWFLVTGTTAACTWLLVRGLYFIHPAAGDLISIIILYTAIASKDLAKHALYIRDGVAEKPLAEARRRLSMIVSRRTSSLSKREIITSTVESVAENISDGIVAPLFFAFLGGPVLAMTYKAVSTMDSMLGYKNDVYRDFGWLPARGDDLFNYIPARLSALFLWLAAWLSGYDRKRAWKVLLRDRKKSSSPNAGWPEAVMAGALGIRFGGKVNYFGKTVTKPFIGDQISKPRTGHITAAVRILGIVLVVSLIAGAGIRYGIAAVIAAH
jgi:adenosylcobinamide-phosphate synthase